MTATLPTSSTRTVALRLVHGGIGPLVSLTVALLLPVVAAAVLGPSTFASWAILGTVTTFANGLDLGAPVALTARLAAGEPGRTLLWRTARLTLVGTAVVMVAGTFAWWAWRANVEEPVLPFLLAAVAVTVAARSLLNLLAAAGLAVDGGTKVRTRALLVCSTVQAAAGVVALLAGAGLYALPVSLGAGTAAGLWSIRPLLAHPALQRTGTVAHLGGWAGSRSLVSAFGFLLNQSDRWLVGMLAGPSALAGYELAWRVAVAPKMLAASLSQTLVADVATDLDPVLLQRRAWRIVAVLVAVVAAVALVAGPVLGALTGTSVPFILTAALVAAHGAHALTAVPTAVLQGSNRPWAEVPYLAVCVAAAAAAAAAAVVTGNDTFALYAAPVGLLAGVGYFALTAPHRRVLR